MKRIAIIACLLVALVPISRAQVGIGTNNPNPSAAVDITSTNKGLLIPQLTAAQRAAIANPATGLLVIQTDGTTGFYYNAGTPATPNWLNLSAYTLQQNINTNGKYISGDGSNTGILVTNLARVGINKGQPSEALDVNGNITYSGLLNMGVQYVSRNESIGGNSRGAYYCGCPQGTKLIGGGGGHRDWNGAVNDIEIAYSGPYPDNTNVWRLMVQNTSGSSRSLLVWAICAKVQ